MSSNFWTFTVGTLRDLDIKYIFSKIRDTTSLVPLHKTFGFSGRGKSIWNFPYSRIMKL